MMDFAGSWVRAIAGAALICAAAGALTPKGRVKGVLKMVCGLVLILSILQPLVGSDLGSMSLDISEYRRQAEEITGSAAQKENGLSRAIIEEELNAYRLDKAAGLQIPLQAVSVVMKWGEGDCWYPHEVSLTGVLPLREKERLTAEIEAELGIPRERQYWSEHEG